MEYMEYILMKEIYHCNPHELEKVSNVRKLRDIMIYSVESKIKNRKSANGRYS